MMYRPVVLLAALGFAMAACSGSDEAATATPAPAATLPPPEVTVSVPSEPQETSIRVFSFAGDDLCEWVTQEEIAGFVAEAFGWNGSVNQTPPDSPTNCEWTLTSDTDQTVTWAYDARQWESMDGTPVDLAALDVVDYSDTNPNDFDFVGTAVSGHPALSEGVVVTADSWGQWAFWVPPREEYLALHVEVPGAELSYPSDDRVFMVADQMLRELGWVD